MSLGAGDVHSGQYTVEQMDKVNNMNKKNAGTLKPNQAMYQKSMGEIAPTWAQRRELVSYLIEESNISPISKNYLKDCEEWVPKYQLRGFKYGGSFFYAYFQAVYLDVDHALCLPTSVLVCFSSSLCVNSKSHRRHRCDSRFASA